MAKKRKLPPSNPVPAPPRLRVLAGAALIVLAVCLAYFPSLSGSFILDDDILLTHSKLITAADGPYRFWCTTEPIDYWPLSNTMLWIEWRLWGLHSTGYHVTSLVLHIAAALLIWVILQRLCIPGAFLAGLLFAVHPVNVESVAWIAQRKNLLAMLFFLLSILWYLKAGTRAPQSRLSPSVASRWYWLSVAAFVLAMLSKGSVAVLPALLLGIVWWLRPLTRRDLVRVAPFILVDAVLVPVNVWFQARVIRTEFPTSDLAERLLGAGTAVWFYLSKAILPLNLAFIYPRWRIHADQLLWWLPLLAVMAVTCALWRYRRGWSRPLLFAWGYFCVALVPVLGFADVGFMQHSLVADHYQHVALIGVIALVAAGWSTWQRSVRGPARWAPNAAAVALVCAFSLLTWQQSGLYSGSIPLYQASLKKNPSSWMAHNNLGAALRDTGRVPEAIGHYEEALRLMPDYPEAHHNLGLALAQTGELQAAISHYQEAVRLMPEFPDAHYDLGIVLVQVGQLQDAIGHYQQAVRLKPDFPAAHNNMGVALAQIDRLQEAIGHFQQALRLKPDFSDAQHNLDIAQSMKQNAAERAGGIGPLGNPALP